MKVRDRLVLSVLAAALVIGGMWVVLVSPERKQVSTLSSQIASERDSLAIAQAQLLKARQAADDYVANVHQIDAVLRAIPATAQEAQVIRTIVALAGTKVDFKNLGASTGASAPAGMQALSLTFNFASTYSNLQSFLAAMDALTKTNGSGVTARGRLFTVNSVSISPEPHGSTAATVTAQVYEQAGPIGPTGASGAPVATPAGTPAVTG